MGVRGRMSGHRSHRRADGTLRPTYRRYRNRKKAEQRRLLDQTPERQAWLAQFDPGARERFFRYSRHDEAVWLRAFAAGLGVSQEEAAPLLERLADERNWRKLRTSAGMVVGIAPLRHPKKRKRRERTSA